MNRMQEIARRVQGPVLCDVGTDHGKLPLMALDLGLAERVIATDISPHSLQKCADAAKTHPKGECVETQVTDGLVDVDTTDVDTIVISGMGGHTIISILTKAIQDEKPLRHLILSPQKGEEALRLFLHDHGFLIVEDTWLKDNDKYYTLMRAIPGEEHYENPMYYKYGKHAVLEKNPVLLQWLKEQIALKEHIRQNAQLQPEQQQQLDAEIRTRKEEYDGILA